MRAVNSVWGTLEKVSVNGSRFLFRYTIYFFFNIAQVLHVLDRILDDLSNQVKELPKVFPASRTYNSKFISVTREQTINTVLQYKRVITLKMTMKKLSTLLGMLGLSSRAVFRNDLSRGHGDFKEAKKCLSNWTAKHGSWQGIVSTSCYEKVYSKIAKRINL